MRPTSSPAPSIVRPRIEKHRRPRPTVLPRRSSTVVSIAASSALLLSSSSAWRVPLLVTRASSSSSSLLARPTSPSIVPNARRPLLPRATTKTTKTRTTTTLAAAMVPNRVILESPSAERNKGPIYDAVLGPIVFPRLIDDAVDRRGSRRRGDPDDDDEIPTVRVLELAAGCGVHTTHFASSLLSSSSSNDDDDDRRRVGLEWHPSDPDVDARRSIDARVAMCAGLSGIVKPSNSWTLGRARGGTALGDGGDRDNGDAGAGKAGEAAGRGVDDDGTDYDDHVDYFDLALCINMMHIAPWEATIGLMECAGRVLRKGGMLVCYGPYKVGGTASESNL